MVDLFAVFDEMARKADEDEWRAALVEELLDLLEAGVDSGSGDAQRDMEAIEVRLTTVLSVRARVKQAANERRGEAKSLVASHEPRRGHASRENMRASAQSLARHLRTSFEAPEEALRQAGGVAQGRQEIAHERLSAAQRELQAQFAAVGVEVRVGTTRSDETTAHYDQAQIVQAARHFDYFAHTRAPRLWTRLHLRDHFRIDLIVSLHAVGRLPRGATACTAFQPAARTPGGRGSRMGGPAGV
jgi:hypothetical protein